MADSLFHYPGREEPFGGETERYVATITVLLDHKPGRYPTEPDLRVVAERAVVRAAATFNFYNTRVVSVDLVSIEEAPDA